VAEYSCGGNLNCLRLSTDTAKSGRTRSQYPETVATVAQLLRHPSQLNLEATSSFASPGPAVTEQPRMPRRPQATTCESLLPSLRNPESHAGSRHRLPRPPQKQKSRNQLCPSLAEPPQRSQPQPARLAAAAPIAAQDREVSWEKPNQPIRKPTLSILCGYAIAR